MAAGQKSAANRNHIARIREFNRFYTTQIGLLQEGLLDSAYSLTELRIMYELLHGNANTAAELADLLRINRGYLSRILKRFKSLGFIKRSRSSADKREQLLKLSRKGHKIYAPLNARANDDVGRLLKGRSRENIRKLLEAMDTIREVLS